jgi:hypothetical protein
MNDLIYSYREMCNQEDVQTLQRGMNFHMKPQYSLILMSRRSNAPYSDRILGDSITIEYEGHDQPRSESVDPKHCDQPERTKHGKLTQNGLFVESIKRYKEGISSPETVKVYEKIIAGVWSLKGMFALIDYRVQNDGLRNAFVFTLRLIEDALPNTTNPEREIAHTRLIPSEVKKEVWKRDQGKCVLCGSVKNLHFDHDLPFSRGGTSVTEKNIRLLCAKCNLSKSDKIE